MSLSMSDTLISVLMKGIILFHSGNFSPNDKTCIVLLRLFIFAKYLSINDNKCLTRKNLCSSMYFFQIGETFLHSIIES
eukprot:09019.XXX_297675_297911_1 [CDS] Oithona nana genome sequencing.